MSLRIVCILYFFFKFYEILFENHILYEKVISIKIIIIILFLLLLLLNQTINLYSTNQLTLEHIHVTFEGKAK